MNLGHLLINDYKSNIDALIENISLFIESQTFTHQTVMDAGDQIVPLGEAGSKPELQPVQQYPILKGTTTQLPSGTFYHEDSDEGETEEEEEW